MGRPKRKIDEFSLLELRKAGKHIKEISRDLGVSSATISRRIAELKNEEGLLLKYGELRGLQLTGLQFKALEALNDERFKEASLLDLVRCFAILYKAEGNFKGKGSFKIHSLVDYLLEIEREEKGMKMKDIG